MIELFFLKLYDLKSYVCLWRFDKAEQISAWILLVQAHKRLKIKRLTTINFSIQISTVQSSQELQILINQMGNYCSSQKNQMIILSQKYSLGSHTNQNIGANDFIQKRSKILRDFFFQDFSRASYQIQALGKIGQGAQGIISLCRISQWHQSQKSKHSVKFPLIAVKKYDKRKFRTEDLLHSLLLEHYILNKIECPFIIQAYSFSENQKQIQHFLPYAKGGDLHSFLDAHDEKGVLFRKLGLSGISFILQGVIIALQALHQNQIVYRDLKLQNILIDQKGYPVLTDFGISVKENQKAEGPAKGSIPYLAPQVMRQNGHIKRSIDIWSLGIMIYYFCFERFPFSSHDVLSANFVELCKQRQNGYSIRHLRKFKNDPCKLSLEDLLNKLLTAQSKDRLGVKRIQQIKKHKFFQGKNWEKYQRKQQVSPLKNIVSKFPMKVEYFIQPKVYYMHNMPKIRTNQYIKCPDSCSTYFTTDY